MAYDFWRHSLLSFAISRGLTITTEIVPWRVGNRRRAALTQSTSVAGVTPAGTRHRTATTGVVEGRRAEVDLRRARDKTEIADDNVEGRVVISLSS